MERRCENCDFYDSEEIVKVYTQFDPYTITQSVYTPMKGACKLLSYTTPHKKKDDWCGSFKENRKRKMIEISEKNLIKNDFAFKFMIDIRNELLDSLTPIDKVMEKEPEELTNIQRLALAITAGCKLEFECFAIEENQYGFQIKTKNKIGVRKIDGKFQIIEEMSNL